MMRITVEIVPGGDESAAEAIHTVEVVNRTGTHMGPQLYSYDTKSGQSGTVNHDPGDGPLVLTAKVLTSIHKERIRRSHDY